MLDLITQRLKSKTYLAALALALLTAVEVQMGFFLQWVPPQYHPWFLMIWPAAMMTLREVTKTALAEK